MKRRAVTALGLAVLVGAAHGVPDSAGPALPRQPSMCRSGESAVYNCRFGSETASVCLGDFSIHYRFGRSGHPDLDIASTADWGNISLGGNRSQGGLNQDHIRFTSGDFHYVVHAGETGALNERPRHRISGIVVLQGAAGERRVNSLDCAMAASFNSRAFSAIATIAPKEWDGAEVTGGSFDVIY